MSQAVWDRQSTEDQNALIDEIFNAENMENAIKTSVKIANLRKLSDGSDQLSEEEKRKSQAKRKNILDNLDKNYDNELNNILGRIGSIENKQQAERARQLAMIKLRKEKQNLKHEDLGYKAHEFTREMTMIQNRGETEKQRQRQLAKDRHQQRLAAR